MKPTPTTTPKPSANRVRLTLQINGKSYGVRPVAGGDLPAGGVRGFTLTRIDRKLGRVAHTVVEGFEGLTCSCKDQRFRRSHGGVCKHLAAARACGLF